MSPTATYPLYRGHPAILLSPPQNQFCETPIPFFGFVGGIGSGKSFVLCYDLIKRCRRGGLWMLIAPTFPMLRDATIRSFFDIAERAKVPVNFMKGEMIAKFPRSGAEVIFRSADEPDRLRGPNLNGVYLDEASLMPEEVYRVCI